MVGSEKFIHYLCWFIGSLSYNQTEQSLSLWTEKSNDVKLKDKLFLFKDKWIVKDYRKKKNLPTVFLHTVEPENTWQTVYIINGIII